MLALLGASLTYALVLGRYGDPDWGPIYGGYLALVLLGALLVAVGTLTSSLTENQVVAAAASLGAFLMLWFADSISYLLPAPLDLVAINVSLIGHFTPFVSGSMFLSDVGYYMFAGPPRALSHHPPARRSMNGVIFVGVLAALILLFTAGLPIPPGRAGSRRWLSRVVVVGGALGVTALAGVAPFRHDQHIDVTAAKAFTPSDDAERVGRVAWSRTSR